MIDGLKGNVNIELDRVDLDNVKQELVFDLVTQLNEFVGRETIDSVPESFQSTRKVLGIGAVEFGRPCNICGVLEYVEGEIWPRIVRASISEFRLLGGAEKTGPHLLG